MANVRTGQEGVIMSEEKITRRIFMRDAAVGLGSRRCAGAGVSKELLLLRA